MMVMRPQSPFKTPPQSRGNSPGRNAARRTSGPDRRTGVSPSRRGPSPSRSGGSPDLRTKKPLVRSFSDRSIAEKERPRTRGSPASRGSETGSIDRLDNSGNLTRIITSFTNAEDNINVVVRVRPLNSRERKYNNGSVTEFPGNGQILCDGIPGGPGGGQKPKLFSFNVVFEPAATQEDVLEYSGIKRLIDMAVEGFNCTAFCYGQTGSGKTHTLTGPPGLIEKFEGKAEEHGLVVRSFNYLFHKLQNLPEMNFILNASFLEIYNEKVIDLLNPGSHRKPLAVRWSKKSRGFFVENLFTVECEQLDDLVAVLEEGVRNRSVGAHCMNEHSSRSHTILTVHIHGEQPAENGVFISKHGKINFVDLAGSEMTKKTHSEGKTLEEANNINKSLMVLGYCISSLSDSKRKSGHIPYRDSKLTKLLADSLAGNGVTLMIACVSPAKSNLTETVNTLRYAARAKRIRTKPIVIMDPREALILSLKREVGNLKTENDRLRSLLHLGGEPGVLGSPTRYIERREIATPPRVDLEQLASLEGPQLAELVRLYAQENDTLRRENGELYTTRDIVMRDQDILSRENERLLKKLEDVNSVCCRSPIIPARPTLSAEMLNKSNGDIDLNSTIVFTDSDKKNDRRLSVKPDIPNAIQKELDKRRIGNGSAAGGIRLGLVSGGSGHRRHNSWDGRGEHTPRVTGHKHSDSADSLQRRATKHTANMQQDNTQGTKAATERRLQSPVRRFSFANPHQQPPTPLSLSESPPESAQSVLPDRTEFCGRSRIQERSQTISHVSESLLSDALFRFSTADREARATKDTAAMSRMPSVRDKSCLSPDGGKTNDVFGSVISVDEDDDDLVLEHPIQKK